tara:strand:+ start:757 stop:900 length:144 start_codon:yes stop_codon:yes gene_type:complete
MNGRIVEMKEMKCNCGIVAKYDNNNNVSYVDAARSISARCVCEEVIE